MSQEVLAKHAGLSRQLLSAIEQRKANPTLSVLTRIAGALKTDVGEIVGSAHREKSRKKTVPYSRAGRKPSYLTWLANPPPGSKAAKARDFGIDLTLIAGSMQLTPGERLAKSSGAARSASWIRSGVSALPALTPTDWRGLVQLLLSAGVSIVVVGGVAMTAQGSAFVTYDLDVAYDRSHENIRRLVQALRPLAPQSRGVKDVVPFRFDERSIRNGCNFTFSTPLGDIDILGHVDGVGDYDHVLKHSKMQTADGLTFPVLSLQGLIRAKRAAGRVKDKLALPELEALAELETRTERDI